MIEHFKNIFRRIFSNEETVIFFLIILSTLILFSLFIEVLTPFIISIVVAYLLVGHPEGYLEGFANIYSDVYKELSANIDRQEYDKSNNCYPTIDDGIDGMKFIENVIKSSKNNSKWIQFNSN